MASLLMLVASSPASPQGAAAFQLAELLLQEGHQVSIYLVQDAVLAARPNAGSSSPRPPQGATLYVLREDLALRGFLDNACLPHAQLSDYRELVELMLERHDRVLGVF